MKSISEFRYHKRNLPHYEEPGNIYFITISTRSDCELTNTAKDIVFTSIKFHSQKMYTLFACVVMNNHIHLIIRPKEKISNLYFSLAQIMHSLKSYSAKQVNKAVHRNGKVWLEERYDRIIRDDDDFMNKMNYTIYNPVRAGLVDNPEEYPWLYHEIGEKLD
jgi:putative transposase